ncbi:hypothetical protein CkaCkLH20_03752 [Colletotrichum karsti]|uniref:Uncharacterized protein n=1 Tax=Colletotrichum karsti TaxID=1095194 RepID=A0A9P6LNS6_9PEZI|nr:uncharacterized protein CkaCkLH20_03752 [Colletotrichum karsti]KAF9878852.1 hypothetical protein CkaCkLH20_03752 [Colletotrichum karsti]
MKAAFMPSLKAWCGGLLQLITLSLLIENCLAKGISSPGDRNSDHVVHEADVATIKPLIEPSTSISIFKRGNGRVVTSIGTSYIDVTIPCTASEIPSSVISLLPTQPIQSLSTSAINLPTEGTSITSSSSSKTDAPSLIPTTTPVGTSSGDMVTRTIIISGIVTETSYYTVSPTGGGTLTVTVRDGTKTVTGPANSASTSSSSKKSGALVWVTATAKQTVTEWWDTTNTATVSSSSKAGAPVVVVTQTASAVITELHDTWETIWVSSSSSSPKPTPAPGVPHNFRRAISTNTTHPANSSIQATSQRVVRIRETIFYNEQQHMASVAVYDIGIGGDERSVVTGHVYDQGGPKDLPSDLTLSDPSGASLKMDFTYGFFTIYFESSKGGRVQSWRNWQGRDDGAPGWCENVEYDFKKGVMTREVNCWYTP